MRIRNSSDVSNFETYKEFGETEIIVDCIGPLIDISKISVFKGIEDVRYLTEFEISRKLEEKKAEPWGSQWDEGYVRKETKNALSHPKLAIRLIDEKMVVQLCKAKEFCSIKIVSTVEDEELFKMVKKVLINFSIQMVKYNPNTSADKGYKALDEGDFEHIKVENITQLPGILHYYKKINENMSDGQIKCLYRIAIDDDILTYEVISDNKDIPPFQEWIGGIRENEPVERLEEVLFKRKHVYDGVCAIEKMCGEHGKIDLTKYTVMNSYYVYNDYLREQLEKRISVIKHIIDNKRSETKPICVFLAGTPGTGKSFFVECFAKYLQCNEQYPVTSLSGVSNSCFYEAIEHHVEQVYNAKCSNEKKASVAFLDEIDTKCDYFAFRFLMDAMTGSRTNDKGVTMKNFKSGTVENLVWFFAGSAGATRQEFMNQVKNEERKVIDFFDRIHFDMQLPSVKESGQAILTLISAIETYWEKDKLPSKISIKVLLAFACTRWNSTRSIMTICRVAAAHKDATNPVITLELFEGIDTSEEFHKQCIYIGKHVKDDQNITIGWKKEV